MKENYVFAGSWSLRNEPHGLSIYSFNPENAAMKLRELLLEDVCVSNQLLDRKKGNLYLTDETWDPRSSIRGGQIIGLHIDGENGKLSEFTRVETLLPKPSYLTKSRDGKWMLAAIHSNIGGAVKAVKSADGELSVRTEANDAGLALFPMGEDGELGQIRDLYVTNNGAESHLHSVNADSGENLFLCCDKGRDSIDAFVLNSETGSLRLLKSNAIGRGTRPRFIAFHPGGEFFLEINEHCTDVFSYGYDKKTGEIWQIDHKPMMDESKGVKNGNMPLDLCLNPAGNVAYVPLRGSNQIVVFAVEVTGRLRQIQKISCGGDTPRSLVLSPDGRYLLCANRGSNSIIAFSVEKEGFLGAENARTNARMPDNLTIL